MARKDKLIRGYAEALFSVAEAEGDLEAVEDELFRFSKVVESNGELREALTDIALPSERKREMLRELLGERAHSHTVNLLAFIVDQGRAREMADIIQELVEYAAEKRKRALAEVRTAVPLTDAQKKKLEAALSKATGRTVELKLLLDPEVIGGVVAQVGDEVFDGSIASRLQEAKEQFGSE
ncbi:MAG: ATP synthase F1 subunit delta [Actinomycetota bacterium]